jgi:uridine kinase
MTTQPSLGPASLADPLVASALAHALGELPIEHRATLAAFLRRRDYVAGAEVVREGDHDRALYFVLSGNARVSRHGELLGVLGSGEQFGELSLLTALPRPSAVVAETALTVAYLTHESFHAMTLTHEDTSIALMDALVGGVASRLAHGLERRTAMLKERTLPRRADIAVRLHGVQRRVQNGTLVRQLLPERMRGKLVVAGLVDRRPVSLTTPLTSECELSAITTGEWEGQRIYRESLGLLAIEAGARLEFSLRLGPSIGFAQRVLIENGDGASLDEVATRLMAKMTELAGEGVPLREELWTPDEAREYFGQDPTCPSAKLIETWRDFAVNLVSYGTVYALGMGPLLPDARHIIGFRVLAGDGVLLLVYGTEGAAAPVPSTMPPAATMPSLAMDFERIPERERTYLAEQARAASTHAAQMTEQQERWLQILGVTSVGHFNRSCIDGRVSQLILVSEGFQEKRIGQIADAVSARVGALRVVCIAGPSSSGKTTFIQRLRVQLQVNGINPVPLSLDDYYVDREQTPKDDAGEYDFEAFDALRVELLQEHLNHLLSGETVRTARYDFATGLSHPAGGRELTLGPRDLLMMEGIHGLNPRLLASIPSERIFRIFVCPLAQLPFDNLTRVHASDVRLVRRLVRDRRHRGHSAADTIVRWPSVRTGERLHIFPFQHHADAIFDTSLIYEPSVLRVFAERYLLEVPHSHPAYPTAYRLLRLLDRFVAIYPEHVPRTSILREFVGGSGFKY